MIFTPEVFSLHLPYFPVDEDMETFIEIQQ